MTPDLVTQTIDIASIAAGTGEDRYVLPPGLSGEWYLEAADFLPATTSATHASNYTTLALKNGSTTLGSLTTNSSGGAALTAGTASPFTLSGGKSREFTARTDALTVNKTDAASGAILDGSLNLIWRRLV